MTMLVTAQRLHVLIGSGLIGLGLLARGGSLMLLGVAALERGSARARRLLVSISTKLAEI